jgi:hypothetical protein
VCKRTENNATISTVVSYNPNTNVTVGYVLSGPWVSIERALLGVPLQFKSYPHPLLLPILMNEVVLENVMLEVKDQEPQLFNIEKKTRFTNYKLHDASSRLSHDAVGQLMQELGKVTVCFAYIWHALDASRLANEFLLGQLNTLPNVITPQRTNDLSDITRQLRDRLNFSTSTIQHMRVYAGVDMRLKAQQDVVSGCHTLCFPASDIYTGLSFSALLLRATTQSAYK